MLRSSTSLLPGYLSKRDTMSSRDIDNREKVEFYKDGIEKSRNMKAAELEWHSEHGPATRLEKLEVKEPLHGPWPRNRNPKYDLDREECGEIKILKNRGKSVQEISEKLWLPERVVEEHLRGDCNH